MPVSQEHVHDRTPMGATLVGRGATFRVWAPEAREVYVLTDDLPRSRTPGWRPRAVDLLDRRPDATWAGFVEGVRDGSPYRFYVVGPGSRGFKRDPWARELGLDPPFPDCDCLVRDPTTYPWHDAGFRPPAFRDLIIYQLHVGVFYGVDREGRDKRERIAKFLDVVERLDHLRALGINAIQLLPIQEFPHDVSLGYNNLDFFSPEMAYQVDDPADLDWYLPRLNARLAGRSLPPLTRAQLEPGPNQLKALVDLCHLNGLAVIFDLVYNHAGGGFDDQSLYFFDRRHFVSNNDSLYFTDSGWAGGLVFAYWNGGVRQFLIDNAKFFLEEYHIDGIRYDEVSVIDNHGGWFFAQDLARTCRFVKPEAIQIAEYWNAARDLAVVPPPPGMGFDAALADGFRDAVREVVSAAAGGRDAVLSLDRLAAALSPPPGFPDAWRAVQCVENHDIVYAGRPPHEWLPRLASLADPSDTRSWYGRSRARVATALLLTAPGIPMLFMGQEILEDKNWSDNPEHHEGTLIWWDGLASDRAMRDHLEFSRALIRLRRDQPALRSESTNVYHVNNASRVLAFHRWVDGLGRDVVVVATLSETTLHGYELGFPRAGEWRELFNSDFFDHFPNPRVAGNGGRVPARPQPLHGLPASAAITLPANSVLVFGGGG